MSKSSTESPIDDLTYDVLTILQKKAKALEAYDKYVRDARAEEDDELEDLFTQMRKRDEEDIGVLKEILARRLDEDLGYEDEVSDEDDEEDYDDEEEVAHVDVAHGASVATSPRTPQPRRGDSAQRHR